jgi:hypothetical protein
VFRELLVPERQLAGGGKPQPWLRVGSSHGRRRPRHTSWRIATTPDRCRRRTPVTVGTSGPLRSQSRKGWKGEHGWTVEAPSRVGIPTPGGGGWAGSGAWVRESLMRPTINPIPTRRKRRDVLCNRFASRGRDRILPWRRPDTGVDDPVAGTGRGPSVRQPSRDRCRRCTRHGLTQSTAGCLPVTAAPRPKHATRGRCDGPAPLPRPRSPGPFRGGRTHSHAHVRSNRRETVVE